jgi:hypothetical protein
MRILFVENRSATLLWLQAAAALEANGHDVFWVVQNHIYAPNADNVHIIPYPSKNTRSDEPLSPELTAIASTDRGGRLFGTTTAHYWHYQREIEKIMSKVMPDVVFGEATQFHELIIINNCRACGIPYLAPNATRYPTGRVVFFKYDTLDPIGGSGENLPEDVAAESIDRIVSRSIVPSYMEPPQRSWRRKCIRLYEYLRIASGWIGGERYITPSPLRRFNLDREHADAVRDWEELAKKRPFPDPSSFKRWVLYPLQLQPESNLDVFGQPWIDQRENMVRAALALDKIGAVLVVKPNPKSKYEMNTLLAAAAKEHENIIPLPHSYAMSEVFPFAPLVLSVTGTVILESIFSEKCVAVLGEHQLAHLPGITRIARPEDISALLDSAVKGTLAKASSNDAIDTIQWLNKTSYDALLWDPITRPDLFGPDSIGKLQAAFCEVITRLDEFRFGSVG